MNVSVRVLKMVLKVFVKSIPGLIISIHIDLIASILHFPVDL